MQSIARGEGGWYALGLARVVVTSQLVIRHVCRWLMHS
jgi:hypothetical protein